MFAQKLLNEEANCKLLWGLTSIFPLFMRASILPSASLHTSFFFPLFMLPFFLASNSCFFSSILRNFQTSNISKAIHSQRKMFFPQISHEVFYHEVFLHFVGNVLIHLSPTLPYIAKNVSCRTFCLKAEIREIELTFKEKMVTINIVDNGSVVDLKPKEIN